MVTSTGMTLSCITTVITMMISTMTISILMMLRPSPVPATIPILTLMTPSSMIIHTGRISITGMITPGTRGPDRKPVIRMQA